MHTLGCQGGQRGGIFESHGVSYPNTPCMEFLPYIDPQSTTPGRFSAVRTGSPRQVASGIGHIKLVEFINSQHRVLASRDGHSSRPMRVGKHFRVESETD